MSTITIPQEEGSLGIPSQGSDTIPALLGPLFLSSHPSAQTYDHKVAASQTLEAYTVVGFNGAGALVKATYDATPANAIKPIGVLAIPVTTGASATLVGAPVFRTGHFNLARLKWDATFTTDALKLAAFEGSPSPTQIKVGMRKSYTP